MRPLVVGYGNSLRGDDGVGWSAVELLAADPRLAAAGVLARHQLTPELALDFSRASLLVLVDADSRLPAGAVGVSALGPPDTGVAGTDQPRSHHVSPAQLLALAAELYGHAPPAHLVSVGVESLDLGDGLSPVVRAALPLVVDAVAALVAQAPTGSESVPA